LSSLLLTVLLAATLGLAGCGSSGSPTPVRPASPAAITILDTEKIERAIESSSLAQRGLRAQVSCPAGVHQKKGLEFFCTAVVKGGGSTRFAVTELDDSGQVHYEAQ
jgi:hypothetical protein